MTLERKEVAQWWILQSLLQVVPSFPRLNFILFLNTGQGVLLEEGDGSGEEAGDPNVTLDQVK